LEGFEFRALEHVLEWEGIEIGCVREFASVGECGIVDNFETLEGRMDQLGEEGLECGVGEILEEANMNGSIPTNVKGQLCEIGLGDALE
jgi:hypothetical protein